MPEIIKEREESPEKNTSLQFLEGRYIMRFDTPIGKYKSKKYDLRKHVEHYLNFFTIRSLKKRLDKAGDYSFANHVGAMNLIPKEVLDKSLVSFDSISRILGHFATLIEKQKTSTHPKPDVDDVNFVLEVCEAYHSQYYKALSIADSYDAESRQYSVQLQKIGNILKLFGYEINTTTAEDETEESQESQEAPESSVEEPKYLLTVMDEESSIGLDFNALCDSIEEAVIGAWGEDFWKMEGYDKESGQTVVDFYVAKAKTLYFDHDDFSDIEKVVWIQKIVGGEEGLLAITEEELEAAVRRLFDDMVEEQEAAMDPHNNI